jgi:hypothetical protein
MVGSVQREDVQPNKIELCDRKICKARSRSGSLQHDDIPTDELESGEKDIHKPGSRIGSGQCADVPAGGTDDNETKVSMSSSGGGSDQHDVPSSGTKPLKRKICKTNCRAGSVPRDHLEVVEEEDSYNNELDNVDSGINSVRIASICSEEAACSKSKIDDPKKSASVKCIDVTEADSVDRPNSRASSVGCRDVTLPTDIVFNKNRRHSASSVNSEASTVIREESPHLKGHKKRDARKRHSSVSSKSSSVQGDEGMDVEEVKMYSTRSRRSGPIQLDVVYEGPEEVTDHIPMSAAHGADLPTQTDDKEIKTEARCRGIFGVLPEDQEGFSGPSSGTNEMFRLTSKVTGQPCRKTRSESGCVVRPVTRSKIFTRSAVGISTNTTATDGSVTDNGASTKMFLRSDIGQDRTGHSLGTVRSVRVDGSFSEGSSQSDVQWKERADCTSRGSSLNTQRVLEEYATNRRLTRHQRSMLERSLELAKPSVSQLTR